MGKALIVLALILIAFLDFKLFLLVAFVGAMVAVVFVIILAISWLVYPEATREYIRKLFK